MTNANDESKLYKVHVELNDIKPVIWRSVAIPGGISLDRLHDVIQIVMGWLDYHLHVFEIGGRRFSENIETDGFAQQEEDGSKITLCELVDREGESFTYEYDFGDSWLHTVTVSSISEIPEGYCMELQCLDGKRASPPEDVGGPPGFELFREAMKDKNHPEHDNFKQWYGGRFYPNRFNINAVNTTLATYRRWSRNRTLPWPELVY